MTNRDEIEEAVCDLLRKHGPDGHVDGYEEITDYIELLLSEQKKDAERYRWLRDFKCNSVTVGHDDEHACNYVTAKEWIEGHFYEDEFVEVPADEIQRMKDLNSIWAIQIYPNTPIGFNKYYGATLDAAIDAAMNDV